MEFVGYSAGEMVGVFTPTMEIMLFLMVVKQNLL